MTSGNFLIGEGLSMEGFEEYAQPAFEEKGYSVADKLFVPFGVSQKAVLVSVSGEGDLEMGINEALSGVADSLREIERKDGFGGNRSTASLYVEKFKTLGTYQADDTASSLFPALAQQYLLGIVDDKVKEVERHIRNFLGKQVKNI